MGVTAEVLEQCYHRALDNRRRDAPKNHFPLAVTEIVSAFDEIQSENQAASHRTSLYNQQCQTCLDAHRNGQLCPYHEASPEQVTALTPEPAKVGGTSDSGGHS